MKIRLTGLLIGFALMTSAVTAQTQALEEGVHFRELGNPLNVSVPSGKGAIIHEFFWYGCIHCYNLEPAVNRFKRNLPDTLAFEPVPATFSDVHELHGRAFYAWRFLGLPQDTHQVIYDEIFVRDNGLRSKSAVAGFIADRYDVTSDEFARMMNSFSVQTKLRVAQNLTADAQVRGTPSVMVNGRYMIESGMPGVSSNEDMLRIAERLAVQVAEGIR